MFEDAQSSNVRSDRDHADLIDGLDVPILSSPQNSRPIAIYDDTIDPIDRSALEFEYVPLPHNSSCDVYGLFVEFLMDQCGISMPHRPVLRQATVLLLMDRKNETEILIRRGRLINSLKTCLDRANDLDESDLFATFLFTLHVSEQDGLFDVMIPMKGLVLMSRHLANRSALNQGIVEFERLWPFLFHRQWSCFVCGDVQSILEFHSALPFITTTKACTQRYLRALNMTSDVGFGPLMPLVTGFLDLTGELVPTRSGHPEERVSQIVGADMEDDLMNCEDLVLVQLKSNMNSGLYHFGGKYYTRDKLTISLSYLLLGAIYSLEIETKSTNNSHRTCVTVFLHILWFMEDSLSRIERGPAISEVYEMEVRGYREIEQFLNRQSDIPFA